MPACARHGISFAIQASCLKALLLSTPPQRASGKKKPIAQDAGRLPENPPGSAAANLTGPVSGRLRGLDRRKHRRAPFTKVVTAGTVVINPALHIAVIWPGGNSNHGKTGQQHAHDRPHANQAAQIPHNFPHKRSVAIRRLQLSHLITYNNYFNSRQ